MLNNEKITELIKTEKEILSKKRIDFSFSSEKSNFRKDLELSPKEFSVFIRINAVFKDNFSIGLKYRDEAGERYLLYRINGKQLKSHISHHRFIHEHILKQKDVEESRKGKPSKINELTAVNDFESALRHFCKQTNILNCDEIFGNLLEENLFSSND